MKYSYGVEIIQSLDYYDAPEEEFGSWSESYSNSFSRVYKTKEYPDIVSDLDIKVGEKCYVVWAVWSSGNSFGWSEGYGSEAIGIFKDKEAADELVSALEISAYHSDGEDKYSFYYKTSDGQVFDIKCVPWSGYFEHLDCINCDETYMEK